MANHRLLKIESLGISVPCSNDATRETIVNKSIEIVMTTGIISIKTLEISKKNEDNYTITTQIDSCGKFFACSL